MSCLVSPLGCGLCKGQGVDSGEEADFTAWCTKQALKRVSECVIFHMESITLFRHTNHRQEGRRRMEEEIEASDVGSYEHCQQTS